MAVSVALLLHVLRDFANILELTEITKAAVTAAVPPSTVNHACVLDGREKEGPRPMCNMRLLRLVAALGRVGWRK